MFAITTQHLELVHRLISKELYLGTGDTISLCAAAREAPQQKGGGSKWKRPAPCERILGYSCNLGIPCALNNPWVIERTKTGRQRAKSASVWHQGIERLILTVVKLSCMILRMYILERLSDKVNTEEVCLNPLPLYKTRWNCDVLLLITFCMCVIHVFNTTRAAILISHACFWFSYTSHILSLWSVYWYKSKLWFFCLSQPVWSCGHKYVRLSLDDRWQESWLCLNFS